MTTRHRFTGLQTTPTSRRRNRSRLARELGEFRSQAELTELAAVLDRHADADTEQLRELVDWTSAA